MRTPNEPAAALAARAEERRRLPSPALRKAIREHAGVTVAELAQVVGVSRQAIYRWEQGTRTPRGAVMHVYLAVLDELRRVAP